MTTDEEEMFTTGRSLAEMAHTDVTMLPSLGRNGVVVMWQAIHSASGAKGPLRSVTLDSPQKMVAFMEGFAGKVSDPTEVMQMHTDLPTALSSEDELRSTESSGRRSRRQGLCFGIRPYPDGQMGFELVDLDGGLMHSHIKDPVRVLAYVKGWLFGGDKE